MAERLTLFLLCYSLSAVLHSAQGRQAWRTCPIYNAAHQDYLSSLLPESEEIKRIRKNIRSLENNTTDLMRRINENNSTAVQILHDLKSDLASDMMQHRSEYDTLTKRVDGLVSDYKRLEKDSESLSQEVHNVSNKHNESLKRHDQDKEDLLRKIDALITNTETEQRRLSSEINKFDVAYQEGLKKLEEDTNSLSDKLLSLRSAIENMDRKTEHTIKVMDTRIDDLKMAHDELNASLQDEKEKLLNEIKALKETDSALGKQRETDKQELEKINNWVNNFEKDRNILFDAIEKLKSADRDQIQKLEEEKSDLLKALMEFKSATDERLQKLETLPDKVQDLEKENENLLDEMDALKTADEEQIQKIEKEKQDLLQKLEVFESATGDRLQALEIFPKKVQDLEKEKESLLSEIATLKTADEEQIKKVEKEKQDLLRKLEVFESATGGRLQALENLPKKVEDLDVNQEIHKSQMNQVFFTLSKTDPIYIIVALLFTMQMFEMYHRISRQNTIQNSTRSENHSAEDRPPRTCNHKDQNAILEKIHPRKTHKKLCILSFYESEQNFHNRLLEPVLQSDDIQSTVYLVTKHEDILTLPDSKMFMVFVDYNERHVILEDPSLGLGDLRLTTVLAIQKMGGSLILTYVKDPGSKNLEDGQLFNKQLTTITTQRELSLLNTKQRVFSVYDAFTAKQKLIIREQITTELS